MDRVRRRRRVARADQPLSPPGFLPIDILIIRVTYSRGNIARVLAWRKYWKLVFSAGRQVAALNDIKPDQ